MTYLARPLTFPDDPPAGFEPLASEPAFDAVRHLQVERPEEVVPLSAFGYSEEEIAACPGAFGATSVFRVMSDEGAATLLEVCRALEAHVTSNPRISRNVRGGTYRSRFLRDLCLSPELTEAMSEIAGIPLLPHTLPHQLGHLNYAPKEVGENVDKWHVDTLRIDFVLFVTDPVTLDGGEFEYYLGTKHEVAALKREGRPLDPARIVAPAMPGPGHAILQQGNMVVHRAKGLRSPGERITMVNGYVPRDVSFPDYTRFDQLCLVDPPHVAAAEYARHMAWMTRERAEARLAGIAFGAEAEELASGFDAMTEITEGAARALRAAGQGTVEHFGD